jgi:hypothetical protein
MNQDELRLPLMGLEPGDDVDLPGRALGKVREELLVEKTNVPKSSRSATAGKNSSRKSLKNLSKSLLKSWSCLTVFPWTKGTNSRKPVLPIQRTKEAHRAPHERISRFQTSLN